MSHQANTETVNGEDQGVFVAKPIEVKEQQKEVKQSEKKDLGTELTEKMGIITYNNTEKDGVIQVNVPTFNVFNYRVNSFSAYLNESLFTMWFLSILIIIGAFCITRKFERFPGKVQNVAEAIVEGINKLTKTMIGHHWKPYAPYFGTILIFLAFCNTIGMLGIPEFEIGGFLFPGLRPPTKDINLPATLAIMTILLVIFSEWRFKGIGGTIKSWFQPIPIMLPFKLMEYIIKPLSLTLRLFGNIFGAFVIMELIIIASRNILLPPVFSLYFDIFDGLLQAFIFTFLSMLYIEEAIE